jgi:hypothetical protein
MKRAGVSLFALFAATAALTAEVRAQQIGAPPLAAEELAEMRGGFLLPTGVEANFGAVARTYADGVLVLETHFTWEEGGIVRQDVLASSELVASDELAGGFVLEDASGQTLFAHQVDEGGVRNILMNEANGRDLRVDTLFTVTLPNFALTQQHFSNALLALHLFEDLAAALP